MDVSDLGREREREGVRGKEGWRDGGEEGGREGERWRMVRRCFEN